MYDLFFTFRSVTYGQKGRDILAQNGIRCRLLRAPREIAPGGCAYALALSERDGTRGRTVLDRAGVRSTGSWLRLPDGGFSRLDL